MFTSILRVKRIIIPACILLYTTACSVQKYERAETHLPVQYRGTDSTAVAMDSTDNIARINYKDFFKDPVLIRLIDSGLVRNYDLLIAVKQIEFASLGYRQSKLANLPRVDATIGSATINRPSDNSMNGMMAGQFLGDRYTQDYNSALSISWEADIWGKIRGARQEALMSLLSTEEGAKAVRIRLISEIAQGYYNLLMLDKQLNITRSNLSFADSALTLLSKQYELGLIQSLPVEQQVVSRTQILKRIPVIENAIVLQENALSVLTGRYPDIIERSSGLDNSDLSSEIEAGIPSNLLSYRPDVRGSELEVRRSLTAVHVAKVSMYPAINITAQGGLNSFRSSNWFNIPGSLFGMIGGSLSQPVFRGKQLKTQYQQSQVSFQQAELRFKQTVLNAVGEVSDALSQLQKLEEEQQITEQLVVKAGDVVNQSLTLFKYDRATYLEIILAQTNKLQAELDLATVRTNRMQAYTRLYRSLGGGSL